MRATSVPERQAGVAESPTVAFEAHGGMTDELVAGFPAELEAPRAARPNDRRARRRCVSKGRQFGEGARGAADAGGITGKRRPRGPTRDGHVSCTFERRPLSSSRGFRARAPRSVARQSSLTLVTRRRYNLLPMHLNMVFLPRLLGVSRRMFGAPSNGKHPWDVKR